MHTNYDINNIFYKIITKQVPCNFILENLHAVSFYDINPKALIHALVIPKGKYSNALHFFKSASNNEVIDFNNLIKDTIMHLKVDNGFKLLTNSGALGGQEVMHYHVHILAGNKL